MPDGRQIELRPCFNDSLLDVMNFLNDVTSEYPRAISFAAGRPPEQFFDVENGLEKIQIFVSDQAKNSVNRDRRFGTI